MKYIWHRFRSEFYRPPSDLCWRWVDVCVLSVDCEFDAFIIRQGLRGSRLIESSSFLPSITARKLKALWIAARYILKYFIEKIRLQRVENEIKKMYRSEIRFACRLWFKFKNCFDSTFAFDHRRLSFHRVFRCTCSRHFDCSFYAMRPRTKASRQLQFRSIVMNLCTKPFKSRGFIIIECVRRAIVSVLQCADYTYLVLCFR